ncbi:hypothetical protein RZ67_01755 [[Haemophilus] ducreyi]|nr:hypothetical protein RZ66_01780 [[Haemophilus] ducreyi]AKO46441.1 hypothetical protein RZ67_01755 [[Haemophilus] ducreyi]AKO47783.1 hypothetical protein RZ68_01755 [[Haemophilus] ducreyi]
MQRRGGLTITNSGVCCLSFNANCAASNEANVTLLSANFCADCVALSIAAAEISMPVNVTVLP